jgi:GT2 family glycosyltransferase
VDLSVIIVNYNVKEFLENLLKSMKLAAADLKTEVIVVDNDSRDGSMEMVKQKFPSVKTICNRQNLGFARANNIGLKKASGKYVLLLNPDTILNEKTLSVMFNFMERHPEVGMSGCKILNPDGTLQLACRRAFPGPWTSFCKVSGLSTLFPKNRLFARYNLTYLDENRTYEVDAISGSFMMMRRDVYEKIGGLDEQFFMYGEDLDLCYRVQKAGFKVFYVHETQIIHFKGESTKRSNINETQIFYSAMRLFVRKHFASHVLVEMILMLGIGLRHILAFFWIRRFSFLSVLLDALFYDSSIYLAEKIVAHHASWSGFPAFAVPVIYTVPVLVHLFCGALTRVYDRDHISIAKPLLTLILSFFIVTSLTYFFKEYGFSRGVVILMYIITGFLFVSWRIVGKLLFHLGNPSKSGPRKVLIVGASDAAVTIAERLLLKRTEYYKLVGFISPDMREVGKKLLSSKIIGSVENIDKVIHEYGVKEVIFSTGDLSYIKIMELVAGLHSLGIEFKVAGSDMQFIIGKTEVTMLEDIPLVEVTYNLSIPMHKALKRAFDLIAVLVLWPLFLILPPLFLPKKKKEIIGNWRKELGRVFAGSMSIIGPKSCANSSLFLGKAGITGLWFTEFEGEQNSEKLDIFYAKNQSVWLDFGILSKSFMKIFSGDLK